MVGFDLGEDKLREKKAPRPGQVPSSSRNCHNNKRFRGGVQSSQTFSTPPTIAPNGDTTKMTKQAQEFNNRRSANVDEYFTHFVGAKVTTMMTHQFIAKEHRDRVDQVLKDAKRDHPCCAAAASEDCLTLQKERLIVVVDFDHRFLLTVPNLQCRHCKNTVTVHPYAVDCIPTAPTENCETWIRRSVVHFFRDLHKNNGLSSNGKRLRP